MHHLERRSEVKITFEYTVKHFQEFGPHQYLITMRFPSLRRKKLEIFIKMGQRLLFTMMILIGKSQRNVKHSIFIDGKELSPDTNKIKKKIERVKINMILDKVFDTQVITGIGDKFHFIEAKKISYMKKERKLRQERRYQSYNRYRRKSNRIYQSQSELETLKRCIKLQII